MAEDFAPPAKELADSGIPNAVAPTGGMGLVLSPTGKLPGGVLFADGAERRIDVGHGTGTSDGSGQIAVSFSAAFPSAPFVVATPANGSHAIILRVQSITATGFLATFFTTAGVLDTAQTQDFFWVAIA